MNGFQEKNVTDRKAKGQTDPNSENPAASRLSNKLIQNVYPIKYLIGRNRYTGTIKAELKQP